MAHGLTLERRLTLIGCAASGRRKTRTHPGTPPRPIRITYTGDTSCSPNAGNERIIEIRNIQASKAGNIVIDAWCRTCEKVERFRLDRITSHRALRQKFQGPTPPVTPYFTDLGPVGVDQLTRPITTKPTTAGLLSPVGACIAEADRFKAVFGSPEGYPRRVSVLTADELLADVRGLIRARGKKGPEADTARFRAVFGSPLAYPERRTAAPTADDHLTTLRQTIAFKAAFVAVADRALQAIRPVSKAPRQASEVPA